MLGARSDVQWYRPEQGGGELLLPRPGGQRTLTYVLALRLPAAAEHEHHALSLKRPTLPAGLPEHLSHTKQALAGGYAVLALDPQDSKHDCWSSTDRRGFRNDQPLVRAAGRGWGQLSHPLLVSFLAARGAHSDCRCGGGWAAANPCNRHPHPPSRPPACPLERR